MKRQFDINTQNNFLLYNELTNKIRANCRAMVSYKE